jgi:hypothetical protein
MKAVNPRNKMSSVITYKNNTPNFGCYMGKAFKFQKQSVSSSKYCYIGLVEINDDCFQIVHDASTNVVIFRNDDNEIYEKLQTNCRVGVQELTPTTLCKGSA